MRAIENRRLKELQAVVRDSMPEILAIAADEMDTASESIRKDGYSDMVRRIQNRFRIMRDRLSRRLKTDPLERDVRRCADYTASSKNGNAVSGPHSASTSARTSSLVSGMSRCFQGGRSKMFLS